MAPHRRQSPWGCVYQQPERSKYWYICTQFPGEEQRRRVTNPRTEDKAEAERQMHALLAERGHVHVQHHALEALTIDDLLDLYVQECTDTHTPLQQGRVEAWRPFGHLHALDVTRATLKHVCRRWQHRGPTWDRGERLLANGTTLRWTARDPKRIRPLSGASCNRYLSVLRRAYEIARHDLQLLTPLTFPHYEERGRGEYITEDECLAICTNFKAKVGREVKAKVFRLAYLVGTRKGRLRGARKRHVHIKGDVWKLKWPKEETKGKRHDHEVVLVGEELEIVQWAWAHRRAECDFLFHVDGKPLGPMNSELKRTCESLGIPYGRAQGIVFHDTRHAAVTNLVDSGTGEAAAMSITGHVDPSVFKRYHRRRDAAQAEAAARRAAYLAAQRGTTPPVPAIPTIGPKK
jgi:integrase